MALLRLALLAAVLLLADAPPAAADNCSGLSDCYFVSKSAVTVTVGIGTVAVALLFTPPISGSPDVKPLDAGSAVPKSSPSSDKDMLGAAIRRGAPPEEWLPIVKATGHPVGASAVVNTVDAVLGKVPHRAKAGGPVTADALATVHDSLVTHVGDLHEVGWFLAKAGPGARGVVTLQTVQPASWTNAKPVHIGHAFNAANDDGRIVFLDGLTGAVAATPHELLAAYGHEPTTIVSVQFVPTHPRLR